MTPRPRFALLLLLGGLTACVTANLSFRLWADSRPAPVRTAQIPGTPEPPLADGPPGANAPGSPVPLNGSPSPVDPPTPVVALRVRVPAAVGQGQEIDYRLFVENRSAAAAHHVTVRNPIPAGARFVRATPEATLLGQDLVWSLGTLPPGACREIVLILAPTSTADISSCARVQFEHGQCVTTRVDRPGLRVRIFGPQQATLYDNLTFQMEVTNTGGVPAAQVVLVNKLPDGLEHESKKGTLSWDVGNLEPGQCRCVEFQAIARKAGRLCNQVAASAAGNLFDRAEVCVTVGEARLNLEMRGPQRRHLGRPATYPITVSNPGSRPLTNVWIVASNPEVTLAGISAGGQQVQNQVQWPIGTLEPGGRRTVQLTVQAKTAGEVTFRASAAADRGLNAPAEWRTLFEGATGLTLDIDDRDDPVEVGSQTSYVIAVINQGAAPATKVQIVATVPEEMEVVSAKGPTAFRQQGQQVIFEPLPALAPRQEALYEVLVRPRKDGEVRFRVELTADQLPAGPVRREESTTIYSDAAAVPGLMPPSR